MTGCTTQMQAWDLQHRAAVEYFKKEKYGQDMFSCLLVVIVQFKGSGTSDLAGFPFRKGC